MLQATLSRGKPPARVLDKRRSPSATAYYAPSPSRATKVNPQVKEYQDDVGSPSPRRKRPRAKGSIWG
ncbi:MAG: hypothetical protein AUI97_00295 [Crenarchaeota archaeon 13_1_40CM_3_52_17]|nr:MAG: hypothetical protein AUI97_00295 [Crenarchaeota archaeon 13_1_40CM_3_52_17]